MGRPGGLGRGGYRGPGSAMAALPAWPPSSPCSVPLDGSGGSGGPVRGPRQPEITAGGLAALPGGPVLGPGGAGEQPEPRAGRASAFTRPQPCVFVLNLIVDVKTRVTGELLHLLGHPRWPPRAECLWVPAAQHLAVCHCPPRCRHPEGRACPPCKVGARPGRGVTCGSPLGGSPAAWPSGAPEASRRARALAGQRPRDQLVRDLTLLSIPGVGT